MLASDRAYWDGIKDGDELLDDTNQDTGFKIIHVEGNDSSTFLAFVAEHEDTQTRLLVFRGTKT